MFPKDFVWGVASSAYQVEGTDAKDGRGKNIWDEFARSGRVYEHQTAEVCCDHMHRYREDFALMRMLGIKNYRFSISWSRILPEGTGKVNEKAVQMYRDMILCMKENGIRPFITLFHWEFPYELFKKGGWLNDEVVQWFGEYAKVVAENFSDLCSDFITINEPQCAIGLGHLNGTCTGNEIFHSGDFSDGTQSDESTWSGGHQSAQICKTEDTGWICSDLWRCISGDRECR